MKKLGFNILILTVIVNLLYSCNSDLGNSVLIDENFETNELRWVEEDTKYHKLEISDGKYHVECKDSTARQTSTGPYNRTFLYDLKENFSVTFEIDLSGRDPDVRSRAGLLLTCPSLQYRIFISNNNEIIITEEIYSDKEEEILLSESLEENIINSIQEITININGYQGVLLHKGNEIGEFTLKSKSIDGVRFFTSALTGVDIYSLKVKNL